MTTLLALLLLQDPARVAEAAAAIRDAAARGSGFEAVHKKLVQLGAKELAASFKRAVHCGACRNGKVACPDCGGKGRRDVPCAKCDGAGRHAPESGVVGGADVTVKCRNCDGQKVFKNAGCGGCGRSGLAACGACQGSPWRDRHCARKDCRLGKVPCPGCEGKGRVRPACAACSGEGRVGAPGAASGAIVSVKCRGCEGKGRAPREEACPACVGAPEGLGRARCEGRGFALRVEDVFTTEPCESCRGAACARCVRILPR